MIREDQLDPDQKDFIDSKYKKDGNIWVQGFAGSGKSVLLVHALIDVVKRNPNARVVIVVFTHALKDMFSNGLKELNIQKNIPIKTYYEFVEHDINSYDYIFCDEVQDLPQRVLEEMKSRGRKIIVAGDSNQSIYQKDPKWNQAVVDPKDVGRLLNAGAFQLNIIHRLTRSIIAAVQKLNPAMNIWGARRDQTKIDVNIRLCEATSTEKEVEYVYDEAKKGANVNETSVILLPKHKYIVNFFQHLLKSKNKEPWKFVPNSFDTGKELELQRPDYDNLNRHLRNQGLEIQYIGNNQGSFGLAAKNKDVIVMTYHSSKGLDFDNVFLPFLSNQMSISKNNEEALFMVALTRSKKNLYLTHTDSAHPFVRRFKDECTIIDLSRPNLPPNNAGETFDF